MFTYRLFAFFEEKNVKLSDIDSRYVCLTAPLFILTPILHNYLKTEPEL